MKKVGLILAILCVFLIGLFIGGKMEKAKVSLEIQKELNWCKSILEKTYPPLPEEVHSIRGKVIGKGENELLIERVVQVSRYPLPEGKEREKQEIKVKLTAGTKIFQEEFVILPLKDLKAQEIPIKEKELSLDKIKIGEEVEVKSKENIKGKKEILADEIQLLTPSF
jgi:hypothetical protein